MPCRNVSWHWLAHNTQRQFSILVFLIKYLQIVCNRSTPRMHTCNTLLTSFQTIKIEFTFIKHGISNEDEKRRQERATRINQIKSNAAFTFRLLFQLCSLQESKQKNVCGQRKKRKRRKKLFADRKKKEPRTNKMMGWFEFVKISSL